MKLKNTTVWKNVFVASASAVGASAVLGAVLALLVMNETLPIERAYTIMVILAPVCVFVASWITAAREKTKRLLISAAVCGMSIVLLLLLRSILFVGSRTAFDHRVFIMMGAFIPAGILASRQKSRRK